MTNADGRDVASPRRLSGPVVITGAGGFLGSRLAERLIGEGLAVIGTSRSTRVGPSGLTSSSPGATSSSSCRFPRPSGA